MSVNTARPLMSPRSVDKKRRACRIPLAYFLSSQIYATYDAGDDEENDTPIKEYGLMGPS